jgi:hypothetical protein
MASRKNELEVVWIPEPSMEAFGVAAVGWWAVDYDSPTRLGPHKSLDECVRAALDAGYSVPDYQLPESK